MSLWVVFPRNAVSPLKKSASSSCLCINKYLMTGHKGHSDFCLIEGLEKAKLAVF